MKKMLALTLLLSLLTTFSIGTAEMGVQLIAPPIDSEPVSLDDIQLELSVEVDGYAVILPTSFEFVDKLYAYKTGKHEVDVYFDRTNHIYSSGNEADYAVLRVDFINLGTKGKNFLENLEVKAVYDDLYEYIGWFYQYNYDNETRGEHAFKNTQNINYVIAPEDNFPIQPMYTGHYCFGCTLPNVIVNSKKPLKLVITIDGNEIIYNIRK